MAILSYCLCNLLLNFNARTMVILAYLLLAVIIYIYVRVLFEAWEYRKKERTEWEKYWDDVFEKNKHL